MSVATASPHPPEPSPGVLHDPSSVSEPLVGFPELRRIFEHREARTYNLSSFSRPERVRPAQHSPSPSRSPPPSPPLSSPIPPPSSTLVASPEEVHSRTSPDNADVVESDDDDIQILDEPPPTLPQPTRPRRSRTAPHSTSSRREASAPTQVIRSNDAGTRSKTGAIRRDRSSSRIGSRATPYENPDSPLRELSPAPPFPHPAHFGRPQTQPHRQTRVLPEDVRYRIAHLINGNAQVGRVEPLAQIHRICPHLQSWEQVTRFVQARPQDAERVRKYAEAYMLRGAKKAFDAGIL